MITCYTNTFLIERDSMIVFNVTVLLMNIGEWRLCHQRIIYHAIVCIFMTSNVWMSTEYYIAFYLEMTSCRHWCLLCNGDLKTENNTRRDELYNTFFPKVVFRLGTHDMLHGVFVKTMVIHIIGGLGSFAVCFFELRNW